MWEAAIGSALGRVWFAHKTIHCRNSATPGSELLPENLCFLNHKNKFLDLKIASVCQMSCGLLKSQGAESQLLKVAILSMVSLE